jgi:hypothetical protein
MTQIGCGTAMIFWPSALRNWQIALLGLVIGEIRAICGFPLF